MENFLINDVLKAAVREIIGYGILGILVAILGYALLKTSRKLIAVLERKGKKTDKQTEIQAKLLDGNIELSRTLMDTAIAQAQVTSKLLTIYKIVAAKKHISKSLLELGNEMIDDQEENK